MTLTKAKRARLAREARKLAMECVEGTAPEFGRGHEFEPDGSPCCAFGHVLSRSGIRPNRPGQLYTDAMKWFPDDHPWYPVTQANDHGPDALPWALLSFANALEEAGP